MMENRSTEWLTAKVADLTRQVKADQGKRPRAYYRQMAIEQRAHALRMYSAALKARQEA